MKVMVMVLLGAVVASGTGLIYVKHQCRQLFSELQTLQETRDELEIEWELLQLEQSTLTTEAAVDRIARTQLDMMIPNTDSMIYIAR